MVRESRSACKEHTASLVFGMLSRSPSVSVVTDRTGTCGYRLWEDRGDRCGARSVVTVTSAPGRP